MQQFICSAQAQPTIKRVILTNSPAAIYDHVTDTEDTIHTDFTPAVNIPKPPYKTPFEAYTAAKVTTLKLTEQWVKSVQPVFDVVYIAPGHVFGPSELVTDPEELLQAGANRIILAPITGGGYGPESGVTVHLDDVVEAHVRALNPSVPENRLYILCLGNVEGTKLDTCLEIVEREFPEHDGKRLSNN